MGRPPVGWCVLALSAQTTLRTLVSVVTRAMPALTPVPPRTLAPGASTLSPEPKQGPKSTPIMAGSISAVVVAVLVALGLFVKRRRASKQKTTRPPAVVSAAADDDNLERGEEQPPDVRPASSAALAVGSGDDEAPPHADKTPPQSQTMVEADTVDGGSIIPPSAPASLDHEQVQSRAEHTETVYATDDAGAAALAVEDGDEKSPTPQDSASSHWPAPEGADAVFAGDTVPSSAPAPPDGAAAAAEDSGAGLADDEDAAGGPEDKSLATTTSIATVSTASMSTAEQEEVAQFRKRQRAEDAAPVAGAPKPGGEASGGGGSPGAYAAASRQSSASDVGLGQAVLAAAQELARSCQIPGVSEAAGAVCIMANLFTDSRENDKAGTTRLRQCRSIVLALKRADKVVGKVSREPAGFVASFEPLVASCRVNACKILRLAASCTA